MIATARYERVSYRKNGQKRPSVVLLDNVRVMQLSDGAYLVGVEVTEEGETKWFANGTVERTHMIELAAVLRRQPMHMDYTVGLLELS